MKNHKYKSYIAVGLTAFCVMAAAVLLVFLLLHAEAVYSLLGTISGILRPIFIGMILAFLLLPVHRYIYRFLLSVTEKGSFPSFADPNSSISSP